MKVSIYRVEQPHGGFGPYAWEFADTLEDMFDAHNGEGIHTSPKQDELLGYIDPGEHCGFATVEQLSAWFDGWEEALDSLGFIVARYSVPLAHVRYGKTQAVFKRGDLFPEDTRPIRV